MPKVGEMLESKYLKKEDADPARLVTVASVGQVNLAMDGKPPEYKWIMNFEELQKPMVMNSTNIRLCEMIFNSDDTDHWIGNKLVIYNDPTIPFQGKLVGGIRVRAPKQQKSAVKTIIEEMDNDIPF